ncbi:unnamed protein product [Miscanthus lutarioriparius]|uniref:Uncharacterized protein n=1 Tax=Miscanthus lutarioriparius TaxID=422564 RepID=A0A811QL25_9POAL|nr:unnamed protein product [Miscanthus lutarioriparius]
MGKEQLRPPRMGKEEAPPPLGKEEASCARVERGCAATAGARVRRARESRACHHRRSTATRRLPPPPRRPPPASSRWIGWPLDGSAGEDGADERDEHHRLEAAGGCGSRRRRGVRGRSAAGDGDWVLLLPPLSLVELRGERNSRRD